MSKEFHIFYDCGCRYTATSDGYGGIDISNGKFCKGHYQAITLRLEVSAKEQLIGD